MSGPEDFPIVHAVRALALMKQAMPILDRAGADVAACYLQMAIDALEPRSADGIESRTDPMLIGDDPVQGA